MEKKTEIVGTADVTLIKENDDGSADYMFNFPPEAMAALTRLGIMTAIQAGIEDAKRLNPDVDAVNISQERGDFPYELRHIAEQAGLEYNFDPMLWLKYEKFAELIVRECADMAESFQRHQYDFTGDLELHEFMKKHFGVEE